MPSGKTHAIVNRALLGEDGRAVQQLMDSTAGIHGPSHRHDHVHTLPGVAVELALRGQLTPDNMLAAALHQATDSAFDRATRGLPRGAPRRAAKILLEDVVQRTLGRKR